MQLLSINNIVEICVPLIAVLLGTAYPIILNNISNIGEKYHSKYLLVLFKQELFQKKRGFTMKCFQFKFDLFQWFLIFSLGSLTFLIFEFKPLINIWIINNSANLLVFILTLSLLIIFFLWLKEVSLYTGDIIKLLE